MDNLDFDKLMARADRRDSGADRRERVLGAPSPEYIAEVLAASGCRLDDDAACVEVLVGRGIRPSSLSIDDWPRVIAMATEARTPPGLAETIVGIWFFVAMVPAVAFASLI